MQSCCHFKHSKALGFVTSTQWLAPLVKIDFPRALKPQIEFAYRLRHKPRAAQGLVYHKAADLLQTQRPKITE
jgi:hypothetical protein